MLNLPHLGQRVRIWPTPGHRVQDGAESAGRTASNGKHVAGKFLAAAGREVTWDVYWHRRLLDGAVLLHDPAPAKRPDGRASVDHYEGGGGRRALDVPPPAPPAEPIEQAPAETVAVPVATAPAKE